MIRAVHSSIAPFEHAVHDEQTSSRPVTPQQSQPLSAETGSPRHTQPPTGLSTLTPSLTHSLSVAVCLSTSAVTTHQQCNMHGPVAQPN